MKPGMDLRVFVYGTLKPGGSNWEKYCAGRVVDAAPARVRGRLFQYPPGFPALVVEVQNPESKTQESKTQNSKLETRNQNFGWVCGSILTLRDEAALRAFDELEEYDPARPAAENLYQRVRIVCFADAPKGHPPGPGGEAWVYVITLAKIKQLGAVEVAGEVWVEPARG